jgi:hypothetical protein
MSVYGRHIAVHERNTVLLKDVIHLKLKMILHVGSHYSYKVTAV